LTDFPVKHHIIAGVDLMVALMKNNGWQWAI